MAFFLVQHGTCLPKDLDPERGLSEQGLQEVTTIAAAADSHRIHVKRIYHSGKKRALQTAEIIATALQPENGVQSKSGLNPLDDVASFLNVIEKEDHIMLVGHLPFMEKLTAFLITGNADNSVVRFQNGGIVCLEKDPDRNTWLIKWTLFPTIE